jgi:hypothetical protein
VRIDVTELQQSAPDDTAVLPAVPPPDEQDGREDLASELAKAAPRRWWNRGTLVLGAVAVLLAGFLGGLQVQKHWGTAATASNQTGTAGFNRNTTGGYQGFPGGAGRPGGFGTGTGSGAAASASAAAATTGTVKLVDGSTIYVQTPDGDVVTVKTTGKTSVQTSAKSSLKNIKAGQTVTVQGPAGSDGTVTATSVTSGK